MSDINDYMTDEKGQFWVKIERHNTEMINRGNTEEELRKKLGLTRMFHSAGNRVEQQDMSSKISISIDQRMATIEDRNKLVAILNKPITLALIEYLWTI